MIPIWDDQVKWWYKPIFTWLILIINVLVFLYQVTLSEVGLDSFINQFALIPAHVSQGQNLYTILTSMFMHGGRMHLIGNMVFLKIFGDNVEARIGNFKFLLFYLLAGFGADFLQIIMWPSLTIPNLGASGAISGLLGAYLLMFPQARIKMLNLSWGQIFFVGAKQFLLYWIGIQLLSWVWSLAVATGDQWWVAYFAHIGGFIVGLLGGTFFKKLANAGVLDDGANSIQNQMTQRDSLDPQNKTGGPLQDWQQSDPMQVLREYLEKLTKEKN